MLHRRSFRAMGCEMLVIIEQDTENAPEILEGVPDWFEDWEQTLSRFRHNSELSRLNRTTDQHVTVSQTLWDVFQASLQANQATDGLVTPTILDVLKMAGYDRPFDELSAYRGYPVMQGYVDLLTKIHPLSLVLYDEAVRSICLPPNIGLDFGGVAKGWAAHQTAERLKTNGPALMNAGGDIAISGPRLDGNPWLVGISNPFQPGEDMLILNLQGGGVATSGKDHRRWMQGDTLNHHIIDPRTGGPAITDILTVTVIAPTVMEAEAAAKAVFLLGSEAGLGWIEADSALAGFLVLDSGQIIISRRAEEYL